MAVVDVLEPRPSHVRRDDRRRRRKVAVFAAAVGLGCLAVIVGSRATDNGLSQAPAPKAVTDYVGAVQQWNACVRAGGSGTAGGRPAGRPAAVNPCGPRPAAPPDDHLAAYLRDALTWQQCASPVMQVPAQAVASCGRPPDPATAPYSLPFHPADLGTPDPAAFPPEPTSGGP